MSGPGPGHLPTVKRSAVTVAGGALIIGGVALMVLPGPGILLVVAGLAVLAAKADVIRGFGGNGTAARQGQCKIEDFRPCAVSIRRRNVEGRWLCSWTRLSASISAEWHA